MSAPYNLSLMGKKAQNGLCVRNGKVLFDTEKKEIGVFIFLSIFVWEIKNIVFYWWL